MTGETRWENLNVAFENFLQYVNKKDDKDKLTLIDLLYVSNFKGGNASITESEESANERLDAYSQIVAELRDEYGTKSLSELTIDERDSFKKRAQKFIELYKNPKAKIRGMRASVASALLAVNFPNLAPVLDRNLLLATSIVKSLPKNGQIKDIENYYGQLIDGMHAILKTEGSAETLRDLDRRLFVKGSEIAKKISAKNKTTAQAKKIG